MYQKLLTLHLADGAVHPKHVGFPPCQFQRVKEAVTRGARDGMGFMQQAACAGYGQHAVLPGFLLLCLLVGVQHPQLEFSAMATATAGWRMMMLAIH
jgi:hypothetical protein